MEHETDEILVTHIQSGNHDLFGLLIDRYEQKLKRYARKFINNADDIEDGVQEVFIKAYVNILSFDATKRFSPWIYRIAHNTFVNVLKKKHYVPSLLFDADTILPQLPAPETADKEALAQELKEAMEHSLDALPLKYKEPLVLYFYEDMNYQDIADVLHIPISTVGVRMQRAKQKLRALYELHTNR